MGSGIAGRLAVRFRLPGHDGNSNIVYDEAGTVYCYDRASETAGGVKQYVVDEEGREGPEAFEAVRRALANLRKMGK